MKTEMRRALAHESFEEKIRKVAQLLELSAKLTPRRKGRTFQKTKESEGQGAEAYGKT